MFCSIQCIVITIFMLIASFDLHLNAVRHPKVRMLFSGYNCPMSLAFSGLASLPVGREAFKVSPVYDI